MSIYIISILLALVLTFMLSKIVINYLQSKKIRTSGPTIVPGEKKDNCIEEFTLRNIEMLPKQFNACKLMFENLNKKIFCSLTFLENVKAKLDMPEQCAIYKELDLNVLSALLEVSKLSDLYYEYHNKLHNSSSPVPKCAEDKQYFQHLEEMESNLKIKKEILCMYWDEMHAYCVQLFEQVNEVLNDAFIEPELWCVLNDAIRCLGRGDWDIWNNIRLRGYLKNFSVDKELNFFNHMDLIMKSLMKTFMAVIDKHYVLETAQFESDNQQKLESMIMAETEQLNTVQSALNEVKAMLNVERNTCITYMDFVIKKFVDCLKAAGISEDLIGRSIESLNNLVYYEDIIV